MKKFWVDISDAAVLTLERAAVEAKAAGKFPPKHGGKKAMAELILEEWAGSCAQQGEGLRRPTAGKLFPRK